MFLKKAAGAVVFYKNPNGKIEYLLLKHSARYWNFPKGGVEAGEREIDTAQREVREETGLDNFKIIPGFRTGEQYYYRGHKDHPKIEERDKIITKAVTFYLIEARNKDVKISHEHEGFEWNDFDGTTRRLRKNRAYKKSQGILESANRYILRLFTLPAPHGNKKA